MLHKVIAVGLLCATSISSLTPSQYRQQAQLAQAVRDNNIMVLRDYIYDHPSNPNPAITMRETFVWAQLRWFEAPHNTVLHLASKLGKTDIIDLFIREGVNLDIRNARHETPLHKATKYGQWEAVRLLLDAGAHADAIDEDGNTPIEAAFQYARDISLARHKHIDPHDIWMAMSLLVIHPIEQIWQHAYTRESRHTLCKMIQTTVTNLNELAYRT